tara:strand:- start:5341 stop:7242 length:1902 start_codon:yes stop_codon:yes gene_type:complete
MATVDDLVVKIKADISQLERSVNNANRSLGKINTVGARSFQTLTKSVTGTTAKVTALVAAIGGVTAAQGIVRTGMAFEDLGDSLNRVFGGAAGGQQAFAQINQFAQTTPFDIETVTKAFIGLKSAGIEPNMKMLQTFADTASVSTDQLGTFETLIRITQRSAGGGLGLEELNQISDRGIDIFSGLNEQLGLSRDQLSEMGKSAEGAKVIMNALQRDLEGKFGGAMADKMDNLSTKLSNLGIAFKDVANEIFQSGLGEFLKDVVDQVTLLVRQLSNAKKIQAGTASFGVTDVAFMEQSRVVSDLQDQIAARKGSGQATAGLNRRLLEATAELSRLAANREQAFRNELASGSVTGLSAERQKQLLQGKGIKTPEVKTTTALTGDQIAARDLAVKLADAGKTDQQKLNEQFAQLSLLDGSIVDPAVLIQAEKHLQNLQDELDGTATVLSEQVGQAIEDNVNAFSNNFVRGLLDGQNALSGFQNFAKDMVAQIISTFIRLKVIEPIMSGLFGGGGFNNPFAMSSSSFQSAFPSAVFARAGGGRVGMGMPQLVGERGPELFVPDSSGVIRSHADTSSMMGGGGVVVNQSINFSTGIVPTVRAEVSRMLPQIADVTKGAVLESAQRGGQFRKGLQGING